jgi:hypothetical protein
MASASLVIGRTVIAAAVIAAAVFRSAPVGAQQQQVAERPFTLGLGFGAAARPGGGVGSFGLATIGLGTPCGDVGVRFDGALMNRAGKTSGSRVTSLTSNLVYSRRIGVFVPYLIGGIGAYAQQGEGTSLGVNGGIGMKASAWRIQPFVESREHVWSPDRSHRATLLTIGVSF